MYGTSLLRQVVQVLRVANHPSEQTTMDEPAMNTTCYEGLQVGLNERQCLLPGRIPVTPTPPTISLSQSYAQPSSSPPPTPSQAWRAWYEGPDCQRGIDTVSGRPVCLRPTLQAKSITCTDYVEYFFKSSNATLTMVVNYDPLQRSK